MSLVGLLQAACLLAAACASAVALRAAIGEPALRAIAGLPLVLVAGSGVRLAGGAELAPLSIAFDAIAALLGLLAARRLRGLVGRGETPKPVPEALGVSRGTLHDLRNALAIISLASAQLRGRDGSIDRDAVESLDLLERATLLASDLARKLGASPSAAARGSIATDLVGGEQALARLAGVRVALAMKAALPSGLLAAALERLGAEVQIAGAEHCDHEIDLYVFDADGDPAAQRQLVTAATRSPRVARVLVLGNAESMLGALDPLDHVHVLPKPFHEREFIAAVARASGAAES